MSETDTSLPIPARRIRRFAVWRNPWLIVTLLALALAFWQWFETRSRLTETQQELARRLGESDAAVKLTRADVLKTQEQVLELTASLNGLEAKMAEFQGQTAALQGLYQELARSRDDATLMEIEQALGLATQQLQLAGNIQVAVLALQTADAKLAVLNRPQFLPLRKALGRDLDRLRALPFVDIPGISLKLEALASAVDEWPLAVDSRPLPEEKKADAAEAAGSGTASAQEDWRSWWSRIGSEVWQELKDLVRIQRFDRTEPVLLAPGQSFFLRENLKLRLLNARLALLSRDQWVFRNDLRVACGWLERHFDGRDQRLQRAQELLKQFSGTDINIELPNLNESHAALRALKNKKEKK
ncbi:MAG: putative uroporphyrinogen-III C-methyltransferase [Betaproteobacteria bacterium ADurb.Bin341]|nr:MAG: putative uroporphyrinogen-III C-methyltransferase [Betaproteobacteria bacterium ADurb.Bin341]